MRGVVVAMGVMAGVAGNAATAPQDVPTLPSGFVATLYEMLLDVKPDGVLTYARFRFVMPKIGRGQGADYNTVEKDFPKLCNAFALPIVQAGTDHVDRIIISLSDREVEFGAPDPEATQFFEAFRIENDACIWEGF